MGVLWHVIQALDTRGNIIICCIYNSRLSSEDVVYTCVEVIDLSKG